NHARVHTHKRKASRDIILFGGLKKETVTAAVEFLESGNRRFSIRDELGENRDDVAPFCELDEFAQSGSDVRHCGHTSVKNRARIFLPSRVSTDSGWNCTPCTGNSRWQSAMISPSSLSAVISRQPGNEIRFTTSE